MVVNVIANVLSNTFFLVNKPFNFRPPIKWPKPFWCFKGKKIYISKF